MDLEEKTKLYLLDLVPKGEHRASQHMPVLDTAAYGAPRPVAAARPVMADCKRVVVQLRPSLRIIRPLGSLGRVLCWLGTSAASPPQTPFSACMHDGRAARPSFTVETAAV